MADGNRIFTIYNETFGKRIRKRAENARRHTSKCTDEIPQVHFDEAKASRVGEIQSARFSNPYDLEPEEETV